ncbi:ImmA/IrrE family metallo-endopeptidase [Microbacterium foliorum]|uniref:ImmA/IrrE family metallo-endopeptidase n=1 Tax=Microbacterium foliorum TaxID=104336 RepID=UPI00099FF9C3|nr:hypothetical protein B2G67_09100 [Microbacterium foliorum]
MTVRTSAVDTTGYDPWQHSNSLGIPVFVRRLHSAHGLWFPDYREILLGDHLRPWEMRCVLSHEIGHAVLGHVGGDRPEEEWAADRFAVRNLITPSMFSAAVSRYGENMAGICKELQVTSGMLRAAYSPLAERKPA